MNKRQTRAEKNMQLMHEYQVLFSTPSGKEVLHDLIRKTGFLKANYVPNDSHGTAYNEGATSIVRYILQNLNYDLAKIRQTMEDSQDEYE